MGLGLSDYRAILEQCPFMIRRADVNGECYYFSARWLSFRGRTLEQECGDGWLEGVHPEDLAGCLRSYRRAVTGVDFTHGICPECLRRHYPVGARIAAPSQQRKRNV